MNKNFGHWGKSSSHWKKNSSDWKRVLCLCLSGVGDALTFTPFIRLLKEARPVLEIDVLVMFRSAQQMMERNPDVSHVYYIDFLNGPKFQSLKEVLRLRRNRYDATIAAYPSNRAEYNLIQILLGGRRIGHRYVHYDFVNLNWLKNDKLLEDKTKHVVENNAALLPFCGVNVPAELPKLFFPLAEEDLAFAEEWIKEHVPGGDRLVGLHAGTAVFKNHIHRRWDPRKFSALAARLVRELDCRVLVFGGPDEMELKKGIVESASCPGNVFSVNETTLPQSAALIKRCSLMVSNDSALMHVAAAMQTPTVAIFAYTNTVFVHPWRVPHRIVRKELPCSPCFFYSPKPAKCHANRNFECIRTITVEEVFDACRAMFENAELSGKVR